MSSPDPLPRYDSRQSYQWNYDHAPEPVAIEVPAVPGSWRYCGREVGSPLGVPAGPLLNGGWCLYYASLGFDVLTYKTVRGTERPCYPLPNLQPVACPSQLSGDETSLPTAAAMTGTWAVSFGMPSMSPDVWRADVEQTRRRLPTEKVLSVSVVGSVQPEWTLDNLADDYALSARWAAENGADCIEVNFSCPNVSTCDGQLYQQPRDAAVVAARVKDAIRVPLIVKIGRLASREEAAELVDALAPVADALAMTNSIATCVRGGDGRLLFDGQRRGICGDAIRAASIEQTRMVRDVIAERGAALELIGVGGASTAEHVREYLAAGASAVHLATAAMVDPGIAIAIRRDLARAHSPAR
jgi:dihydroorotate dehydrogenase